MEELISSIGMPLLAVVVPIVVAAVKKLMPSIPSAFVPVLAAVLGPLGDFALQLLPTYDGVGWAAALIGLAGIGIREIIDQVKKVLTTPSTT